MGIFLIRRVYPGLLTTKLAHITRSHNAANNRNGFFYGARDDAKSGSQGKGNELMINETSPGQKSNLNMDPPTFSSSRAALPSQRRRTLGACWVEKILLLAICFAVLSQFKLETIANDSMRKHNSKIDLPRQSNHLEKAATAAEANNCRAVIESLKSWERLLWPQSPEVISELNVNSNVKGDYVEVDNGNDCEKVGRASLAAANIQRAVIRDPTMCGAQKRAIWLAFENESCVNQVSKMFEDNNFVILDETGIGGDNVDVPIFLLNGDIKTTLADSKIGDIAMLRLSNFEAYEKTLFALFAFYRRVHLNGYVVTDQWHSGEDNYVAYSHMRAMGTFFTDTINNSFITEFCGVCPYRQMGFDCNVRVEYMKKTYGTSAQEAMKDLLSKSDCVNAEFSQRDRKNNTGSIQLFQKNDTRVRVPKDFRNKEIVPSIDPKVTKAWDVLNGWHRETVRRFFGHVGTNPYQTYRYIEALRHIIQRKQQQIQNETRVNICETGFNGGHSAMLFLSFLDLEKGIKLYYYGWDLKEVGSSLPTAEKMKKKFGDYFTIVWGDSKETLRNAEETMNGQKCDLIVVDGEHSKNGVVNDVKNLLKVAEKGAIMFGDDCAPYKRTVPKSEEMLDGWNSFVRSGDLISVAMYRNPDLGSPGFVEGIVPGSNGEYTLGA